MARKENLSFQLVILRYLHERFLYRLSISEYTENFLLKGGALLYALEGSKTRSTKDIDFLGENISNNFETITRAFIEVCSIEYPEDFVWFDANSVRSQTIADQEKYPGIRIFVNSGFDTINQRLQIDIGFGDVVSPAAVIIDYPLLLSDLKSPRLMVYSVETIIAEKFQAMIELSTANSRMKDFYDVYKLIESGRYNKIGLQLAIKATFARRNTPYRDSHALFEIDFANNANRIKMWKSFLKKTGLNEELDFSEVMHTITIELAPYWESLKVI
ncbi:MAG: nucleotidyl transferase AbiEii/AbiGii toxin family protein [Bacteroidales bacterium]|nr:nucleotidyl transferase AbiEii/AbiGii toxin family protein [Bacteroidales bacterium]